MGILISGKEIASHFRNKLKDEVYSLKEHGIQPGLAVILVGNDPASRSYVKGKQAACVEVGIHNEFIHFEESISEIELLTKIDELNRNPKIHGILVQLPLPKHIDEQAVIRAISPTKDVDGFHPVNVGNMLIGQECFLPCTPYGIIEMVKYMGLPIKGKHVVVVGRSNIVGKPVGQLFLNEHATVTYTHSQTVHLEEITKQADILVVAVGRAGMIHAKHVKEGAVVIDVGVNRLESGKLTGDVLFEEVEPIAGYITPVPGGVGPMTITMLIQNTVLSAKKNIL